MPRKQRRPELDALKKVLGAEPTGERGEASEAVSEHEAAHYPPTNPEFALKPRPRLADYADYVEHPRFGKAPRFTGLDPNPDSSMVHLHYNTGYRTEGQCRSRERWLADMEGRPGWHWTASLPENIPVLVPGTAVEADLSRQIHADIPVTHYYDLDKICIDCERRFLFFAEEQKHWYEDLGFALEANAVRCTDCRKRLQNIAQTRKRFEQLLAFPSRSVEEALEMVEDCLTLIEAEEFSIRQCERVRMLLKRLPEDRRSEEKFRGLTARLHAVERRSRGEQVAAPISGSVTLPGPSASDEEPKV